VVWPADDTVFQKTKQQMQTDTDNLIAYAVGTPAIAAAARI
jgi:hypothetical protein